MWINKAKVQRPLYPTPALFIIGYIAKKNAYIYPIHRKVQILTIIQNTQTNPPTLVQADGWLPLYQCRSIQCPPPHTLHPVIPLSPQPSPFHHQKLRDYNFNWKMDNKQNIVFLCNIKKKKTPPLSLLFSFQRTPFCDPLQSFLFPLLSPLCTCTLWMGDEKDASSGQYDGSFFLVK